MLALIAGEGRLPPILHARAGGLVCALEGVEPDLPVQLRFRLERLGTFIEELRARGVTTLCMAGAIRRPALDPAALDAATLPLVPRLQEALALGDDGALRLVIELFEEAGISVTGAAELVPELLPPAGSPTRRAPPSGAEADAAAGAAALEAMGKADLGQAVIVHEGRVIAQESEAGTAALIRSAPAGAVLYKAPKPGQELRADMPAIGAETAAEAAAAGLSGLIIAAGGVILLDAEETVARLDAAGLWLWVRP
ncbi:UDP-2,3-diacylglucosamine diphosphatase LpxI domain-containing protein [Pseudoroseicyclus tamaricis]|uniref:LpxI family protein n=1 Tax=Pseudoroseicyclus tamaricis TaxID=2705421 RepID=A0A6B2JHA6_9RHOB|nr:UDP-2,3-diacylglucosamine diphosphatase LpxI [Pseudoroseicyclus tamaricis]NDV00613.1 LpxI family protein [Pseudoroseicyclus tamaricis]